ncbi:aminopeptidase N [Nocardioides sp. MAH-18]|uniref:Aminopeptidase N n=1 Tax=Nocardioides agri TaxID=2682843 RepID=A0A6L6XYW0_9ACTN|nr:aminopeptidase N [Nocardioides sp. CGMCC 1.13656]MBA2952685.1 aminopeptidase N [Nocardioides sp. CGMCC 1.13656]MVQ51847.1 aminopeptidase N [Nocardioides sp. MAH-18]
MSSPYQSLQRTEAVARHELLDVEEYDVRLDLAADDSTFGSVTTIRFTSRGGPTFVDLKPVRVNEIRFNGSTLDADLLDRGRLPLETVEGHNELVVDAVMPFRNDGEGLHRSTDPADGESYVYGMMFMDAAPSVFACFDQPDLKAPYTVHVRAPRDWTVIANAPGTNPEPGVWEFARSQPLSTYFVTVVAGPYHVIHDQHDGIPLGLSARKSIAGALEADADELFTMTKQSFDELHRLFGIRYPFGNYHQAFVPEFNAGAMENPGCVTFRDPLVFTSRVTRGMRIQRASTLAHEMAHQWFGNIVTPKWWDDLWLNESFAEYIGNRVTADVTEYDDAWVDVAYARRQWGLYADQRPSSHPVAGNGAVDATAALQDFDGISYAKGSSILKQLAASLGDEVFFAGAIDHFTRHRFGNATMHDLLESWERAGAGDLSSFTSSWLRTAGPDTIVLDRGANVVRRTPPAEHPADRSHTFRVAVATDGKWSTRTLTIEGPETPFVVDGEAVVLDPYEDSWAVLVPDADTVAQLKTLLPAVEDEGLRAGIWNNLRSAFHVGEVSAADVVDLVVASPPVESTEDSKRRLGSWLLSDVLPLAPAGSIERVHAAALDKVGTTPAGSEHQLAALRMAISTSTDPAELRGWLASTPAGIDLDVDLRWRVLVRLAALGATDAAELDDALAADPNGVSRVEHMRARVSLPTPEAKELAWSVFTGAHDVANYELEAAGLGMWRGGQEELVAPYVDRYFDELPATVGVRSGWVLADATEFFFPATSLSESTLERARALAADASLPLSVRRRLGDCADDMARKLQSRHAFPA